MSLYQLMLSGERGFIWAGSSIMGKALPQGINTLPELFFQGFMDALEQGEGATHKDAFERAVKMYYG